MNGFPCASSRSNKIWHLHFIVLVVVFFRLTLSNLRTSASVNEITYFLFLPILNTAVYFYYTPQRGKLCIDTDSTAYLFVNATLHYFNEALGDFFSRYGAYFINGLGMFTVSITASGMYLIYQRDAKRMDTEKYEYYIPLIGQKSASVLKLSRIFNELTELKPEQERL